MKKSLKKFALISMSAMTIASLLPVSDIGAQVNNSETTSVEETSIDSSETTETEEEEGSDLQKAFKDAVEAFKETYPEVDYTGVKIKPLEENEEEEFSESTEETTSEETTVEESTEEESEEEEEEVYEIEIMGLDAEEEVSAKYDSSTGDEIVEEDAMSEVSSETTSEDDSMAATVAVEGLEEETTELEMSESTDTEASSEETGAMVAPNEGEILPIDMEAIKPLDEVTKLAEETAGFGKAYEWELTANPTDPETSVWFVKVAENAEKPEEGKQGEVSIDAQTLEVLATSGDIDLDAANTDASRTLEEDNSGEEQVEQPAEEASQDEETRVDDETSEGEESTDDKETTESDETSEGEETSASDEETTTEAAEENTSEATSEEATE